ncbi:MAG: hypothetical protein ACOC6F_01865 [bacterium]
MTARHAAVLAKAFALGERKSAGLVKVVKQAGIYLVSRIESEAVHLCGPATLDDIEAALEASFLRDLPET